MHISKMNISAQHNKIKKVGKEEANKKNKDGRKDE